MPTLQRIVLAVLLFLATPSASTAQAVPPASEALFKRMLLERPDYASQPGRTTTVTIHEFHIERPVRWTMEYGQNPAQDRNTLVYRVRARYTVHSDNFNTATGRRYPPSSQEYRRRFNYYVGRNGRWTAEMTGTTADWH
ncbi:MAG TPA: hypothetical protein VF625_02695 [Longimicrobium sp.]|jgi:hypothetical protein